MSMEHSPTRRGLRVLRRKDTAARCGVHVATVMRWASDPATGFPQPVQITPSSTGFFEHEVDAWLASRPRGERDIASASEVA